MNYAKQITREAQTTPKGQINLSVVIITFNEEKNIERCLKSVAGIADEIVVIDSYSTDKTEEICRKYNARFIQHTFAGHIEQKNWALKQAENEHVLALDADEELSEELRTSIRIIKNNWSGQGYCFNRLNNYCGTWIRHSGWYPDRKLRLFNRMAGEWAGTNPHDKFCFNNHVKPQLIRGDLYHYTYYTIEEHVLQSNKFSTIAAKQMLTQNKKIAWYKILLNPMVKFIKHYFIKAGFLDGYYGFFVCKMAAHETFLKYSKAYHLQRNTKMS